MNILGFNFGHDAGVSLVKDGMLVRHWEKERHTRVRHAIGLNLDDITRALTYLDIDLDQVHRIATCSTQLIPVMLYDDIHIELQPHPLIPIQKMVDRTPNFFEVAKKNPNGVYRRYLGTLNSPPQQEILFLEQMFPVGTDMSFFELASVRSIPKIPTAFHTINHTITIAGKRILGMHVSHHLCHAYYAYSQQNHDSAAILTSDGSVPSFSFKSGGLYFATGGMVSPIHYHRFFWGGLFDAVSDILGLGRDGAGKLMGLAAWGQPIYYQPKLVGDPREAIYYLLGETGEVDYSNRSMVQNWLSKLGVTAEKFDLIHCDEPPRLAADIAASAQQMFTDAVLGLIGEVDKIAEAATFGFDKLILSGGCALNCFTNSALFRRADKPVFIPPAVNDEGNSVGAAMCCASLNRDAMTTGARLSPADIAYKGVDYPLAKDMPAVGNIRRLAMKDVAGFLATQIAQGAVAGIFDGRAEIGPRALGHRSLVASPLISENWKRINLIKGRELWRPLAPVVLDSDFHLYFEGCPKDSYFMLFNAVVKGGLLPAITHRDGSARVQVAVRECGFIYNLLLAFRAVTGVGVLLNTSFNGQGEPIVETPEDAFEAFAAMDLDYLYLQGALLEKAD